MTDIVYFDMNTGSVNLMNLESTRCTSSTSLAFCAVEDPVLGQQHPLTDLFISKIVWQCLDGISRQYECGVTKFSNGQIA